MQRKKGLTIEEESAKPANNQLHPPDLFPVSELKDSEDIQGGEIMSKDPNSLYF